MSKRFRKHPQGPTLGHFVVFGEDDWTAMESNNVYGHALPRNVRELVSLATLYLTLVLPLEKSAPRISDEIGNKSSVEEKLARLKKQAEELRAELFSAHYWAAEYQSWAPEYQSDRPRNLGARLALELDEIGGAEANDFDILRFALGATIASCDRALKNVTVAGYGNRDGQTWDIWVVLLTLIMKSNQLPYGTRKDAPRAKANRNVPARMESSCRVPSTDPPLRLFNPFRGGVSIWHSRHARRQVSSGTPPSTFSCSGLS